MRPRSACCRKTPPSIVDLALVLLETPGRTAEAVAHLREAIRLQPGNEPARRILSRIAPDAP